MAYRIDFSAAYYRRRWIGLTCVMVAVLGALGSAVWGGYEVYRIWNLPTLQQQLATYQMLADGVEPSYERLRDISELYEGMAPYLGLCWGENAEDLLVFLHGHVGRHPDNVRPLLWRLHSGGGGSLSYEFQIEGFRRQAQVESVREVMQTLLDQEDETGARLPRANVQVKMPSVDLARAESIPLSLEFPLRAVPHQQLPAAGATLDRLVQTMKSRRQRIHATVLGQERGPTVRIVSAALMEIVVSAFANHPDQDMWRARAQAVISPSVFFREVERALGQEVRAIPALLTETKKQWEAIANRRWPWHRNRELDDAMLAQEIDQLKNVLESGMPTIALLDGLDSRLQNIRSSLLNGYSISRIFDEGDLHRETDAVVSQHWEGASQFNIQRGAIHNGLMLAPWSLRVQRGRPDGQRTRIEKASSLGIAHAVAITRALHALQVGLVIETIEMQFQPCEEHGPFGLQSFELRGILPIREQVQAVSSGNQPS